MTTMTEIKSNEDLTKALVAVKRSEGGALNSVRLTKKHAKANGISWAHFENSIRILGLKVKANGLGHTVTK
jgi:hypothetical protein